MKHQPLENVQRWMQAVITHPAGVDAGLAALATQSHLELPPDDVEQIIEPSHRQSSVERLSVYANAYYTRLIECLEAEFPVFRQTVGDDTFAEFAVDYLRRYPSQSYTLSQVGENFVRYLNETKPTPSDSANWPEFLIDLARLERTVSEVFDGPGMETKLPLRSEDLLAIDPDLWPRARLTTAACLRLLSLRFPLNDYYTAMRSNNDAALPQMKNSWMAITRRDYIVRRYPLSHCQFTLLEELQRGQTVGQAIAAAAAVYPGKLEQLAADLQDWFRIWTAAPMFEKVTNRLAVNH
jgi:hypothetical protein